MDSRKATREHIAMVAANLAVFSKELAHRGDSHDNSKLHDPEVGIFDEFTPKLAGLTYGSDEYKACLEAMAPALKHHYANNRHHPEHFSNGVSGMNLVDLVEMFCDWKAAVERHDDGDLMRSIEINAKRFGLSGQLRSIFENTAGFAKPETEGQRGTP